MNTVNVDVNRGFRLWHVSELYDGNNEGYLPNKDDMIVDYSSGFSRVISVNYSDLTYETIAWDVPSAGGVNNDDYLLGSVHENNREAYRVYVDDSVYPHNVAVDSSFVLWGSSIKSYKIFKGSDIGDSGKVLTRALNSNLEIVDSFISVENVDNANGVYSVPKPAYFIDNVNNGEMLTLVAYNEHNSVVNITRMLAVKTGFVRTTNQNTKFVTGIRLVSPYLDNDSSVINVPINMPIQSVALQAAVKYSDGSEVTLPVDGGKVRLDGASSYVATIVGQSVKLVLKYYLSDDEVNYSTLNGSEKHIARVYTMKSINVDGAHTVKMLTYPTWDEANGSWSLKHWLVNLERNICRDITSHVRMTQTSDVYNPSRYGVVQRLAFSVNLRDVSPMFNDYQHVQTVNVNLISGPSSLTPWTVEFTPDQEPPFGWNLFADMSYVDANQWKLKLDSGHDSEHNWLVNLYRNQEPLFDSERELEAPDPTHFRLVFKNGVVDYNLYQYKNELIVPNDLKEGETLFIQFYRRIGDQELYLGVAGIPVRFV